MVCRNVCCAGVKEAERPGHRAVARITTKANRRGVRGAVFRASSTKREAVQAESGCLDCSWTQRLCPGTKPACGSSRRRLTRIGAGWLRPFRRIQPLTPWLNPPCRGDPQAASEPSCRSPPPPPLLDSSSTSWSCGSQICRVLPWQGTACMGRGHPGRVVVAPQVAQPACGGPGGTRPVHAAAPPISC